jgi:hypothetical protein
VNPHRHNVPAWSIMSAELLCKTLKYSWAFAKRSALIVGLSCVGVLLAIVVLSLASSLLANRRDFYEAFSYIHPGDSEAKLNENVPDAFSCTRGETTYYIDYPEFEDFELAEFSGSFIIYEVQNKAVQALSFSASTRFFRQYFGQFSRLPQIRQRYGAPTQEKKINNFIYSYYHEFELFEIKTPLVFVSVADRIGLVRMISQMGDITGNIDGQRFCLTAFRKRNAFPRPQSRRYNGDI